MSTVRSTDVYNINSLIVAGANIAFSATSGTVNVVDTSTAQTLTNKTLGVSNIVSANSLNSGSTSTPILIGSLPTSKGQVLTYNGTNFGWSLPSLNYSLQQTVLPPLKPFQLLPCQV